MGSCLMVDIYIHRCRKDNDIQDIEPLVYIRPLLRSRTRRYNLPSIVDIYKNEEANKKHGAHMHGIPNRRFQ